MESGSGNIAHFSNDTPSVNATGSSSVAITSILVGVIPSIVQLLLCGIVLRVFYQVPSLRKVSNLPVIHLVTSDFVRATVGFLAVSVYGVQTSKPSTFDTLLCQTFQVINNAQFAWSNWAIAIVAYSRADVIVNVLAPTFTKRKFWCFAIASWLVSVITSLPPLVGWSSFGLRRETSSYIYTCGIGADQKGLLHALYLPLFFAVNYFVPSVLVALCFSRVLQVTIRYIRAHNSSNNMQANIVMLPADDSSPSHLQLEQQRRERAARNQIKDILYSKAFRYIVALVMTNLLLVAPYVGVKIYDHVCSELWLERETCAHSSVFTVVALLYMLNFNINALLYVFWIKTIQQSTVNLFCCRRR